VRKANLLIVIVLVITLIAIPAFSLAESDYEEGDGWVYRDGELKITASDGLVNYIYHDEDLINDSPDQQSPFIVDRVVIGKNVTADIEIEYFIAKSILSITTIEDGNPCYIVDNGWIVNTVTKTIFGAANVEQKKALTEINDLPNGIEHIGMYAFDDYSNLAQIKLPDSLVSIREHAFSGCRRLNAVLLPHSTISIGVAAFDECTSLVRIEFGSELFDIQETAFDTCINLKTPPLYKTKIEIIHGNSFWGCNDFQIVELPESLKKIENQSFGHCKTLSTLIFNSDQLIIEDSAFASCENIRELVFTKGKPTFIGSTMFDEDGRTPDGKKFILYFWNHSSVTIPYPTLYYTAAYADEWAPNGETEWNGYTIQQISQEELDAILAEARGEEPPETINSPVPTATPQVETPIPGEFDAEVVPATGAEGILLAAIGIAAIAVAVVLAVRLKKEKR